MSKAFPTYYPKENVNYHPHVVILGAGASRAAFPNGDKQGRKLPILNELIEVVGLEGELKSLGIKTSVQDFEATYDQLSRTMPKAAGLRQIREKTYAYFASLELPYELTLYDRLILSLRPKDIIATFNWDPLLGLAFQRNRHIKELPKLAFFAW